MVLIRYSLCLIAVMILNEEKIFTYGAAALLGLAGEREKERESKNGS
jgi:hypothetical protein